MVAQVPMNPQRVTLPAPLREQVDAGRAGVAVERPRGAPVGARRQRCGPSADEDRWLGWLDAPAEAARGRRTSSPAFAKEIARESFTHALLLGMGGSSLGPEVLRLHLRARARRARPARARLDRPGAGGQPRGARRPARARSSSSPASRAARSSRTSSSSTSSTAWRRSSGADRVGQHFVAITDPGSKMQQVAEADGFRRVFLGDADDRRPLLGAVAVRPGAGGGDGRRPRAASSPTPRRWRRRAAVRDPAVNPGVVLGLVLGRGREGRPRQADHRHLAGDLRPRRLARAADRRVDRASGAWPSSRSTSKRCAPRTPTATTACSCRCARRGRGTRRPRRRCTRWPRRATRWCTSSWPTRTRWRRSSSAGRSRRPWPARCCGINPFDQPDVEASKIATRALTTAFETTGALPAEAPVLREGAPGVLRRRRQLRAPSSGARRSLAAAAC